MQRTICCKLVLTCECGIVKTLGTVSTNFIDKKITNGKDHCLLHAILSVILCFFCYYSVSLIVVTTIQNTGWKIKMCYHINDIKWDVIEVLL